MIIFLLFTKFIHNNFNMIRFLGKSGKLQEDSLFDVKFGIRRSFWEWENFPGAESRWIMG